MYTIIGTFGLVSVARAIDPEAGLEQRQEVIRPWFAEEMADRVHFLW